MASSKLYTAKDGRQYYKIEVYRGQGLSNYNMRWYIPEGMSFNTKRGEERIKKELAKIEAQFENDCKAGKVTTKKQARIQAETKRLEHESLDTFKTYCLKRFLAQKGQERETRTVEYYRGMLEGHIWPYIGDRKLPDITSAQLSAMMSSEQNKGLSLSTLRGIHVTLNQVFRLAYITDAIIDRNPMDRVQRPVNSKGYLKKDIDALTPEELGYFLECVDNEPLKWRTFIYLMAFTGCRVGEICALQWDNINYEGQTIEIRNNAIISKEHGILLTTPKGKTARIIPINDSVLDLISEYALNADPGSPFLFPCIEDHLKPMSPQSAIARFGKLNNKYDLPKRIHAHLLRHTYASLLVRGNADIASVSALLGHADISTTLNMYVKPYEESKRKAAQIFNNMVPCRRGSTSAEK